MNCQRISGFIGFFLIHTQECIFVSRHGHHNAATCRSNRKSTAPASPTGVPGAFGHGFSAVLDPIVRFVWQRELRRRKFGRRFDDSSLCRDSARRKFAIANYLTAVFWWQFQYEEHIVLSWIHTSRIRLSIRGYRIPTERIHAKTNTRKTLQSDSLGVRVDFRFLSVDIRLCDGPVLSR